MPRAKRAALEPTEDWEQLRIRFKWPEQVIYELIRPVVVNGQTPAQRAKDTGENARTIARRSDSFDQVGMASVFAAEKRDPVEDARSLPYQMRQLIVDLRFELPSMPLREVASICAAQFDRRPSHHTVQHVLASGPPPSIKTRRYPTYAEIADPAQRRLAIVRLHFDGWRVSTIARYLETTRRRVYETLRRWVEEQFAGMPDKSHAPKQPATKVNLETVNEIRKLQQNPEIGEWRVRAALLGMGINISARTCGRVMARNRELYGLERTRRSPRKKKEMPFKAGRRHEYWSIDIRYIEKHKLEDQKPVYVISILENYSRALLASSLSKTQDMLAVLMVLFRAFRAYGVPEAIVSDGGSVFQANHMLGIYRALGIRKERIAPGQPWMNYIESHFGIMRRLTDYSFAQAESWEEMLAIHSKFANDYNHQVHWAHRDRQDGRHSPAVVLDWVQGTVYPEEVLHRVVYATQFARYIDQYGYVRFRNWRFYGERGLSGVPVDVWVYDGSLRLEYEAVQLANYSVAFQGDGRSIREVRNPRLLDTPFQSPQMSLFDLGADEWLLYLKAPEYSRRRGGHGERVVQLGLPMESLVYA